MHIRSVEEFISCRDLGVFGQVVKKLHPLKGNYKEIINVLAPILYNSLALNHRRESEFVNLGGLPYLKTLSIINLPFRQFILPIICEFVHCDASVVNELKRMT